MENNEYEVVRITKEGVKDICYLMNAVGNSETNEAWYQDKFNTSFTGVSFVGYVAYHIETKEPAAFYGVFPCFMMCNGKKTLVAQSGDTVTNPKHQKKGLFVFLAQKTYSLSKDLGVELVFGFPNDKSKNIFYNRLNWIRNNDFVKYGFEVFSFPLNRIMRRLSLIEIYKSYVNFVCSFFPTVDKYPQNSLNNETSCYLFRDENYYEYKKKNGNKIVTILGVTIWFKIDHSLLIGDIWFNKNMNKRQVVIAIKMLSFFLGLNRAELIVYKEYFLDKFLAQIGDSKFKISTGAINLNSINTPIAVVHTWADSDTF